ncbi:MAG: cupin domain-containing protein [Anaerolineales bacterium]|jgi:transcriptional regulator with XRE-family HTH domain
MADHIEPNVGLRLRFLREQRGLSLRALAKKSGLSLNTISLIERGDNSPTVSTLHRMATALDIPITDFFQEEARQTTIYVKQDRGLRSQSDGAVMESLGIGLVNQKLEPFRMVIRPGSGNWNDPVSHSGEEFVYCLEGEIDYMIDDRAFRLEQGDSLLFDATQLHSFRNPTEKQAVVLMVFLAYQDPQTVRKMHLLS